MIFQDPKTSINLKMTVRNLIKESLKLSSNNNNIHAKLLSIANQLFIDEELLDKKAKNLSGGQRRRVGIAKIIAGLSTLPEDVPKLIIADEPVASLDASIKHEIMKCLVALKDEGYTVIIISHDIQLVHKVSDTIMVIDNSSTNDSLVNPGKLIEIWDPTTDPVEEKTKELLSHSEEINSFVNEFT